MRDPRELEDGGDGSARVDDRKVGYKTAVEDRPADLRPAVAAVCGPVDPHSEIVVCNDVVIGLPGTDPDVLRIRRVDAKRPDRERALVGWELRRPAHAAVDGLPDAARGA